MYSDLSAEIQEHLDERIEEGMPKKDAAAAARREFGNVTLVVEDSREVWRWRLLENFAIDVR